MNITTNFKGRLRNTSLPYSNGLLPVFETVANSIHAIEDAGLGASDGYVKIEIIRNTHVQLDLTTDPTKQGSEPKGEIQGFMITDNGIGFDNDNMTSFFTLDSEYKAKRGGRGVGRLLWLKAFLQAKISSKFTDQEGKLKHRKFIFEPNKGIDKETLETIDTSPRTTCVHLDGFIDKYQKYARKKADGIAHSLFEHCLWYFIRDGGAPHITIIDDEDRVELDTIYETRMVTTANTETIKIKNTEFDLIHMKLLASSNLNHSISLCAASRLVKEENITGKIPGLFGMLHDDKGDFTYRCYVSSSLFDEKVRPERTSFDIDEEPMDLFEDDLSLREIREQIIERATTFLADYLEENKQEARKRVEQFIATKAPRYRPIISHIPEDQLFIDPGISDKDLDLKLHGHFSDIENQLLKEGHDIMSPHADEDDAEYKIRIQKYLSKVVDIKKSDLANYVSHRKVIIDLLEKEIRRREDGSYAREDVIHSLIMPMKTDSSEILQDNCNLWLIDERLAFHDYLASDKSISAMPITEASEDQRPDLVSLNVFYDNPILVSEGNKLPLASIVVIELKRPMRNDAGHGDGKDPIEQALDYVDRIRQGKIQTSSGRPIPESNNIPGFCYVLCDLTPTIKDRCKLHDAILTNDGLGYFFHHKNYNAYVEVISFDRLVNAAKERNRAFFDKLGLPTR